MSEIGFPVSTLCPAQCFCAFLAPLTSSLDSDEQFAGMLPKLGFKAAADTVLRWLPAVLPEMHSSLMASENRDIMSANQSRRRIEPFPSPGSARPNIDNTLPYQERGLDKDSIRLVEIQPEANDRDPLVCTLEEATFGSRPKFEALSYMWATERVDDAITLNGLPFKLGRNLLDALLFLRHQLASGTARRRFWIDAICINQSDVEERNRQLWIMDQIYFRVSTVVVWLGSRYTEFQRELAGKLNAEEGKKREEGSSQSDNDT
jgi:heterokaryon incompatibility protein (HET)